MESWVLKKKGLVTLLCMSLLSNQILFKLNVVCTFQLYLPKREKCTLGKLILIAEISIDNDRGKGEYYRLGNESTSVQSVPTVIDGLVGKNIVQIAVGALHCLALTSSGEV